MSDLNSFNFTGRIGAIDGKLVGDTTIAKLRIACNRQYKKGEEWQEETNWFNVDVFGGQAERIMNGGMKKGDKVSCSGRLQIQKGKDEKYYTVVRADSVNMLSRADSSDNATETGTEDPFEP